MAVAYIDELLMSLWPPRCDTVLGKPGGQGTCARWRPVRGAETPSLRFSVAGAFHSFHLAETSSLFLYLWFWRLSLERRQVSNQLWSWECVCREPEEGKILSGDSPSLASWLFITMETELPSSFLPAGWGCTLLMPLLHRSEVPSSFLLQKCHSHHRCPSTAAHT